MAAFSWLCCRGFRAAVHNFKPFAPDEDQDVDGTAPKLVPRCMSCRMDSETLPSRPPPRGYDGLLLQGMVGMCNKKGHTTCAPRGYLQGIALHISWCR